MCDRSKSEPLWAAFTSTQNFSAQAPAELESSSGSRASCSSDGASPRRVSGYRLAANALVEQRVRRARLCNSHSPEAQDEEAEELGV